jgi:hypothetical protein
MTQDWHPRDFCVTFLLFVNTVLRDTQANLNEARHQFYKQPIRKLKNTLPAAESRDFSFFYAGSLKKDIQPTYLLYVIPDTQSAQRRAVILV